MGDNHYRLLQGFRSIGENRCAEDERCSDRLDLVCGMICLSERRKKNRGISYDWVGVVRRMMRSLEGNLKVRVMR